MDFDDSYCMDFNKEKKVTLIHIHAPKPIDTMTLWCPYCDEVLEGWPRYEWYEDTSCPKCKRVFGPDPRVRTAKVKLAFRQILL